MSLADPISDYLTRIRNGIQARKNDVLIPTSKLKVSITKVLEQEGYIVGHESVEANEWPHLKIKLKYNAQGTNVIRELARVSKLSCRVYKGAKEVPVFRNGTGTYIVSTPKGVMTDKQARRQNVGGEILCSVW